MAELDVSNHSLNTSTSKQKFTFPKTDRFHLQQKIKYLKSYRVARASTTSLVRVLTDRLLLGTGKKTSDCAKTNGFLQSAHMSQPLTLRSKSTRASPSGVAETQEKCNLGNGYGRSSQRFKDTWVCPWTGQLRCKQVYS